MITNFKVTNFKGFQNTVDIPIRPITLLFGTNSSGKSSVLQALQYVREVLERQNIDADRTTVGAAAIDLGGFSNFVFSHDNTLDVSFRLDMDLSGVDLPQYEPEFAAPGDIFPDLSDRVETAWIKFTISWSDFLKAPFASLYEVGVNDELVARIESSPDGTRIDLTSINFRHSLFLYSQQPESQLSLFDEETQREAQISLFENTDQPDSELQAVFDNLVYQAKFSGSTETFALTDLRSAIPSFDRPLNLKQVWMQNCPNLNGLTTLTTLLSQLLLGVGKLVLDDLRLLRYIGPIRTPPPREYTPVLTKDESRWASGLAAWDALYQRSNAFLDEVSSWLSNEDRLNTGYELHIRQYKELDLLSPLFISLSNDTYYDDFINVGKTLNALPTKKRLVFTEQRTGLQLAAPDIGIGLSQIVPVVVAALDPNSLIVAIEQPELHMHPAVQVALGDLFAEQLTKRPSMFLIETHSEHLLLRLIRRIREANDSEILPPGTPQISPEQLSIVYLEQSPTGITVTPLRLDKSGEFIDRWPNGFFEERALEMF